MKKQYIKPLTTAYAMETELPLASSITFDGKGGGSASLNDANATGDALSKGGSFDLWGDDEN